MLRADRASVSHAKISPLVWSIRAAAASRSWFVVEVASGASAKKFPLTKRSRSRPSVDIAEMLKRYFELYH